MSLLGKAKLVGWILMGVLALTVFLQRATLERQHRMIENLNGQVTSLHEAMRLTEELNRANQAVTRTRDDTLRELRNAEGRDTPLPPDVRRALERLR
jgi:hypothetical protein